MFLLKFVPKNLLSYLIGLIVHIPLPAPLSTWSIQWFAGRYNINMEEAEHPVTYYKSIGHLFTRKLKSGVRPIGEGEIVHPADAKITTRGVIADSQLIQTKGKTYTWQQLVRAENSYGNEVRDQMEGGSFLTYYLCPTDYHRVHSPVDGEIVEAIHIPGRLWPVNPWSVENIEELFSINERVVVWIKTKKGPVALVMVGATNVGKMTMSFDDSIVTNQWPGENFIRRVQYDNPLPVKKGDELGVFNMGSTVIMIYPKGMVPELPQKEDWPTKMGENLF